MLQTPRELVDGFEAGLGSFIALCRSLDAADHERPTGCPGWTVKDQVSHQVGLELEMLGEPVPAHTLPDGLAHVRDELGRHMEIAVDIRRPLPPDEVLAELSDVFERRRRELRSLPDDAFDEPAPGPRGSHPPRGAMLAIRLFDIYAHEQDVRRATGRPGHLAGPLAEHARDRILLGLGRTIDVPVAFELDGQLHRTMQDEPAVTLRMPFETFVALGCGRSDADRSAIDASGDGPAVDRVLGSLAVTP